MVVHDSSVHWIYTPYLFKYIIVHNYTHMYAKYHVPPDPYTPTDQRRHSSSRDVLLIALPAIQAIHCKMRHHFDINMYLIVAV